MLFKTISTFEELYNIDNELFQKTCRNDLMHVRTSIRCLQGYTFILGPDVPEYLEAVYVSYDDYRKWTDGEKEYCELHYGA